MRLAGLVRVDGYTGSLPYARPNISSWTRQVQQEIRAVALKALLAARSAGAPLMEIEFPPLLGGRLAKRSTDDYTNIEVVSILFTQYYIL
jgi:hypothetical protein